MGINNVSKMGPLTLRSTQNLDYSSGRIASIAPIEACSIIVGAEEQWRKVRRKIRRDGSEIGLVFVVVGPACRELAVRKAKKGFLCLARGNDEWLVAELRMGGR